MGDSDGSVIPVLNQEDFPALPQIEPDQQFEIQHRPWLISYRNFAASVLIGVCITKGHWQPVEVADFEVAALNHINYHQISNLVFISIMQMIADGELELFIAADGNKFIVPTPKFAKKALGIST